MSTTTISLPSNTQARRYSRQSSGVANLLVLAGLMGFLGYVVAAGLPFLNMVEAAGMLCLTQLLPGVSIWRCIRPRNGWLVEDLVMGFAVGITLAVPSQVIGGLLHTRWPAIVLPLVVGAIFWAIPATRRRIRDARWSRIPWWLGVIMVACSYLALPALISYARTNRLSWTGGPGAPHVDTYLHIALSSELLTRGPVGWPTVKGPVLGYEWLAHAWIAQVTAASNVGLDQIEMRFLPALMPIVFVSAVVALTLRVSGSPKAAALAALLAMAGGAGNPFSDASGMPFTPLSPTLGLSVPTLLALISVLVMRWRGQAARGAVVMVPILTIVTTGTKGSTSPLVIAGLGLALVAMLLWNRSKAMPVLIDLIIMAVSLGLTLRVIYHGSTAGLKLGITASAHQTSLGEVLAGLPTEKLILASSGLAIISGLTRAVLAFALPFHRASRRDPLSWLLIGGSIAGACAVGLFSHPGHSQGYFLMSAVPLAAVGSALGARQLLAVVGRRAGILLVCVGIVGGLVFLIGPDHLLGPLHHHQYAQVWTHLAVALVVVVVVAAVCAAIMYRRSWLRGALVGVALVGLLSGTWSVVKADRRMFTPAPIPAPLKITAPNAVSNGELAAARYIRDHSGVEDVVMTNRHCTVPRKPYNGCDSRRWLVTAFTERQSLVEGWTATPNATKIAPIGRQSMTLNYWRPQILKLNDGFIAHPTEAGLKQLWALGVRWAYVESTEPHATNPAPFATVRFHDHDAAAWQLTAPAN
ncbi:hypothetical protein [Leekyejoonella antrihumi]|uniref:Uncharacterized protein n=1 Tax=Leekyejoonella antrihumi TaxID=1660198 RepID=A0A563DRX8_9MICO|nr:hypothetical protein [Leekyejoonella antrihumi]TWP32723.1 hypothetical protein FGL98_23525 [Leekyejoonella antrihumi]